MTPEPFVKCVVDCTLKKLFFQGLELSFQRCQHVCRCRISLFYPDVHDNVVPRGRLKKERFRKENIRGPQGEAAAQVMAEPAGGGDDEVWVPYHYSTCGERGHFSTTCRRPHV